MGARFTVLPRRGGSPRSVQYKAPIGDIQVQIDWLRQVFIEKLNIVAIGGRLSPFGISMLARKMRPLPALSSAFLGPVKLATLRIDGNANAPFRCVGTPAADRPGSCPTRVSISDPVEVGAHHSHPLRDRTNRACCSSSPARAASE